MIIDSEECDDGNFESGDGCSQDCIIEDGYDVNGKEIVPPIYYIESVS